MSNIFDLFKKIETPSVGPITHIVVGLGNPGKEYDGTRHNAGFILLDTIAAKHNARIDRARFRALTGEAQIGEKRALLMKPQTFMNLSGNAVGKAPVRHHDHRRHRHGHHLLCRCTCFRGLRCR